MAGLAQRLDLSQFAAAGMGPRLVLVAVGAVMTILMQSSSAAVATTLTALAAGTISLDQAAALVIGQNLGTSAKAGVAAIGASAAAKRTALVHLVFNVGTGLVAFALLPLFVLGARTFTGPLVEDDPAVAIAAFHTAFNLLGAAIFLPLTPQLARLATRLIPERGPPATRYLDPSLHEVPAVAVDAAFKALRSTLKSLLRMVIQGLQPQGVGVPSMRESDRALDAIRAFLKDVSPSAGSREFQRLVELLHVLDHVTALRDDLREIAELDTARTSAALRPVTQWLAVELQALLAGLEHEDEAPDATRAEAMALHLKEERRSARPHILSATAQRQAQLDQALRDLAAQRWLDAIAGHVARAVVHLRAVRDG
jgi:phosphate:Na+ symporter